MTQITNESVAEAFDAFPVGVRQELLHLRKLILETADAHVDIGAVEETLKWGQPSYLAKGGSTVRLGVPKSPDDSYAMYFNCNSKLVDTFRTLYGASFSFEGDRAIVWQTGEGVDEPALRHCVELALRYHRVKHLPPLRK